jgi:hypothetical protein
MSCRRTWRKRLDRLEPLVVIAGCPTCHGWTGVVLEGDDGWLRPECCPECGRVVPAAVVVHIAGIQIAQL